MEFDEQKRCFIIIILNFRECKMIFIVRCFQPNKLKKEKSNAFVKSYVYTIPEN